MQTIDTPRLRLVGCDEQILEAVLNGRESLSQILEAEVPDRWTEFGTAPFRYVLEKIRTDRSENNWWTWLPILREENILIGSGGYKGSPDEEGVIEIGYEIMPACRNLGLATEMAGGLTDHAFTDARVKQVIAHTLAHENPSTRVLTKCGFIKIRELELGNDGLVWKWAIMK